MTDKSNVNSINLQLYDKTVYKLFVEYIVLQKIGRRTQHFTKIDQKKCKIEQICIWNPMNVPHLLCKHWFMSSAWIFCH